MARRSRRSYKTRAPASPPTSTPRRRLREFVGGDGRPAPRDARGAAAREFIQRDCVIAATAPFALIAEGLNCLSPQTPPPAAAPAPAPEPEKPDGGVALDNKFDVFVCTNV